MRKGRGNWSTQAIIVKINRYRWDGHNINIPHGIIVTTRNGLSLHPNADPADLVKSKDCSVPCLVNNAVCT